MSEDVKPDIKSEAPSEHINLKVVAGDGGEVHFKIKKTTKMQKLMDAYCQRTGITLNSVRFLFDGNRISPDSTAGDIGLEEGDAIDVMQAQTGGHYFSYYSYDLNINIDNERIYQ